MKKIIILFILVSLNVPLLSAQFTLSLKAKNEVIPFQFVNNLILIPIEINGKKCTFILDSGAEANIFFNTSIDSFSLQQGKKFIIGGLGENQKTEVTESTHNAAKLTPHFTDPNLKLFILNDTSLNPSAELGVIVNGIIGQDFFKNHLIQIDYVKKKITINHHHHHLSKKTLRKYQKVNIQIHKGLASAPFQFLQNNQFKTLRMIIDLGNSDAIWYLNNDLKPQSRNYKPFYDYLGQGINGKINGERMRIVGSRLDKFYFEHAIICLPSDAINFMDDRPEDGLLGNEIWRRFHLIFDYKNEHIYLKPNLYFSEKFNINNSGMTVKHDGLILTSKKENDIRNKSSPLDTRQKGNTIQFEDATTNPYKYELRPVYKVRSVRPASPAEKAGIKVGDEIVSIRGNPVAHFTLEQINEIFQRDAGELIHLKIKDDNGAEKKIKLQLEDPLPIPKWE